MCVTGVLCVLLCVSVCLCDRCVGVRGLCVCNRCVVCTPWRVACQSSLSFLGKNPGVGCLSYSWESHTRGVNPGLLHCKWILYYNRQNSHYLRNTVDKNPKDSTQSYETTLIQRALNSTGQSGYQHLIAHGLGVVGDLWITILMP